LYIWHILYAFNQIDFDRLPGSKVIIANPETKGQCGDSHLGEVIILAELLFM
jgi:hypothetical protein